MISCELELEREWIGGSDRNSEPSSATQEQRAE